MVIWFVFVICVLLFFFGCFGFDIMFKFKVSLCGFNVVLKLDLGEVCFVFFVKEVKSVDCNFC